MIDLAPIVEPLVAAFVAGKTDAQSVAAALLKSAGGALGTLSESTLTQIAKAGALGVADLLEAGDAAAERDALMGLAEAFAAAAERHKFGA